MVELLRLYFSWLGLFISFIALGACEGDTVQAGRTKIRSAVFFTALWFAMLSSSVRDLYGAVSFAKRVL